MLQRLIIFFSWALISVVIWRPDFGFAQASRPHSTTAPKAPPPPTPVVPANIPGLNSSAQALGPVESLFKVDEIRIQGNKKVESEAILEKIRAQKGGLLDNYMLRKDIQIIYGMKYFDYVEAQQVVEGGKNILIYVVKERPIVQKIEFEGNSDLDDDELKEKIKTKEYNIQNVNEVKADVLTLQKYYEEKGYFLATIDYKFQQTSPENVTLTFDIKESDKIKVKKITFLGNRSFTDNELKTMMETREDTLFAFISGAGSFKELNFQTDIERLKYFYKTKGHLQVNIGQPEVTVSKDKKWIFISMTINEGPKFFVNEISFDGELLFTEEELQQKVKLKYAEAYSEETLRLDIQTLTEAYQDEGYAFANVLRTLDVVPGETKVNVRFTFEKGKMAYFGNISIKGNSKSRDKVIRRELKIREGMRYSGSLLRESKENINRLGFFEANSVVINTVTNPKDDSVLDVEISVKETNTGQIQLGAGYSTATKGFIQASVAQRNFRGMGQDLSLTFNLSEKSQEWRLGFVEPYLFDTKWTAGGDVFRLKNEVSRAYHSKKQGLNTRVGYPIFEFTRVFVTYKLESTELTNVNDPTINSALENGIVSAVETSLTHDKRDNRWQPTKGHYTDISLEVAGVGGDYKWLKSELDGRLFYTIYGDLIWRSRMVAARMFPTALLGDHPKEIPRSRKFVLGGARNLRGFNYEDIGPKQTIEVGKTDNGESIMRTFNTGGLFSMFGSMELEHPLVREAGLKWVLFVDGGNVYDRYMGEHGNYDLRFDYGFGFRWFSPIGVLRFEFGYPVNKKDDEDSSQFHFDIGQLF